MLTSGDVVDLDLGLPVERESGILSPAVLVTAPTLFAASPNVVYVVPVTTRNRGSDPRSSSSLIGITGWTKRPWPNVTTSGPSHPFGSIR